MLSSKFFSRLLARHGAPTKIGFCTRLQNNTRLPHCAPILVKAYRFASSSRPVNLNLLSDVEEYVKRDFTLTDLEKKRESENLPELVTTETLISECETRDDLLHVLQQAAVSGKLWKDELLLYLNKFSQLRLNEIREMKRRSYEYSFEEKIASSEVAISDPQMLLDNPYFQHLLRQTLMHSSFFTSRDLAQAFSYFVNLQVPPASSTMTFLVAVMQNRVNDFFPLDVLICFSKLRLLDGHSSLPLSNFEESLLQHLENQTADEIGFMKVLDGTSLQARFRLHRAIKKGSKVLRQMIIHSCLETIKRRRYRELKDVYELRELLRACIASGLPDRFLLRTAANFVRSNKDLISETELTLLKVAIERLEIPDARLARQLSLVDPVT